MVPPPKQAPSHQLVVASLRSCLLGRDITDRGAKSGEFVALLGAGPNPEAPFLKYRSVPGFCERFVKVESRI